MSGHVQSGHGNVDGSLINWSQPPTASDGPDAYIKKLLAPVTGENGGCDFYQHSAGNCPPEDKRGKILSRLVNYAAIAFATITGGMILKKSFFSIFRDSKAAKAMAQEATEATAKK